MFFYDGMLCPICEVGYMKEERNYADGLSSNY